MSTGIRPNDALLAAFESFKMKKTCQYQVFRIVKETIELTRTGEKGASWDELKEELVSHPKDGAYAVFDYHMERADGSPLNKIVFISWVPGTCPVRPKMLYGSSMESFKQTLNTPFKVIQASDIGDLDEKAVKELCTKV